MRVLVTGGAGFIGSHLVERLVGMGLEVFVIDNFSTGKKENIGNLYFNEIRIYEEDIENSYLKNIIFSISPEYIFHCAALPRVEKSIASPLETHNANVNGTLNVLLASKEVGVKKVIFSSSSSVYGNKNKFPVSEKEDTNPIHPYGLQKLIGEKYCKMFSELYGLSTVSLRYHNVYGDRMAGEGAYCSVLPIFMKQKREGSPLTIVPDGNQSRDFTFVGDVVDANILAMENEEVGKTGEVFNIGSGEDHSVNEIADLFGGEKIFIAPRIEPKRSLADISKARKVLGWEPKENLLEWIKRNA